MDCPICNEIMEERNGSIQNKTYNHRCPYCGHTSYVDELKSK